MSSGAQVEQGRMGPILANMIQVETLVMVPGPGPTAATQNFTGTRDDAARQEHHDAQSMVSTTS